MPGFRDRGLGFSCLKVQGFVGLGAYRFCLGVSMGIQRDLQGL